ncbi:MAG: hypothetical protein SFX73_06805 [Kofleriaceae bacterium]|nr:hypothetical protein [Kofleriaceae bacterium]
MTIDEHPVAEVGAAAALARLFIAADRLGIDGAPLQDRAVEVVPALIHGAWASLDSDNRLAIQCRQTSMGPGTPIDRPAYARRFELEQGPDGRVGEIVTALGRRAFSDDRETLLQAGVPSEVVLQIGPMLELLVLDGRCDGLARKRDDLGETWFASVAFDAMELGQAALEHREQTKSKLLELASALGVHSAQRALLAEMHWFAHHGFSVSFQFGHDGVLPILYVEYANIPWEPVAKLAHRLRPVPPQPPRLGTFAGAFDASEASSVQIGYIPNGVARVRVSVAAP